VFKINYLATFGSASANAHACEETLTDRLIGIGRYFGIEMSVKKI